MSAKKTITRSRARQILDSASKTRILVIGDLMVDRFIWGTASRISPEAPVPVVEVKNQESMPGGAANVARNLAALGANAEIFGIVGRDEPARELRALLRDQNIACSGMFPSSRPTTTKTRVIAHTQQLVRYDRETREEISKNMEARLFDSLRPRLDRASAVIVGDYAKGVVTQNLLERVKSLCDERSLQINIDSRPARNLKLRGFSMMKPNRKEAFQFAKIEDENPDTSPLNDKQLLSASNQILEQFQPKVLMITLANQGMLLCQRGQKPLHIPTVAQSVYDVSGAGDTVMATFTLARAGGASLVEAAILSNHAAGIVVGKVGTAVTSRDELLRSFK
ncbi:MAG: D-glycero-beta-D-manno-heptose-7-phosphate kinase [Candidatus Micrarchaeota archaeon]|nr:D-glycero-beta-D-manno-heptose-7-phosphate kinase [Candidatus Micrarchaeota archaeon]